MSRSVPWSSVRSTGAMVASADAAATQAGLAIAGLGGTAADMAIAANAVLAVTGPHLCGLGGDLFALVHDGSDVFALDAAGRAGSGSDAESLRREGRTEMPFRHDVRTVTVPGCVDGWIELHRRFGELPLGTVLAPAIGLADDGFPASPLLVASLRALDERARRAMREMVAQAVRVGARVRRPGVARALRAIAADGRAGFYLGEFGRGLSELGAEVFSASDLAVPGAGWVTPLASELFGHTVATIPPPSQGYLLLGSALLAEALELPSDPDDPDWIHLLVEAALAAGHDRPDALADGADGDALLAMMPDRLGSISRERASRRWHPSTDGDTTYLCAVDREGRGVSLIQSNASGFGSWLVEPSTGINLHNRGLGFSLTPDHPAELRPGARPPHTLSPALVTRPDGSLHTLFGTMGGDAQPQILLQLLVRLLHHRHTPADAVAAARWAFRGPDTGFDTWTSGRDPIVTVEGHAPSGWSEIATRGHLLDTVPSWDSSFGHAHVVTIDDDAIRVGAADPRSRVGSCAGTTG